MMRGLVALCVVGCGRIAFDPLDERQTLYVAGGSTISAYAIEPGGALADVPGSPFASKASMLTAIALDASGRFLVAAGRGPITLASFSIDPTTGALAPVADADITSPALLFLAVHPTQPRLYASNNVQAVHEIALDPIAGTLRIANTATLMLPNNPQFISVDPLGRWIFIPGNGGTRGVDVGALDASGAIIGVARSGTTGSVASASTSDPSGRYIYFSDSGAAGVFGFAVDQATGAVSQTPLPGTPAVPFWTTQSNLMFAPNGTSLYVFDDMNGVYHFIFDPVTGGITADPPTVGPTNAGGDSYMISTVMTSDGAGLYGVDTLAGVHGFTVAANGTLAALAGSPFPTPDVAVSIAITR